ncbi:MAG: hypothetical protein H6Q52_275 [Deltaproteobacteria bacterium]|nr:hypothetical protein [Deltaproteobacteria bacterium]
MSERKAGNVSKAEMETLRERALEVIACYERTKSTIRKEVRKEFGREIHKFEEERAKREKIVKDKMIEIDSLEAKIESLNNSLYGLQSKSKLWEHECARISEAYHRTVMYYSNPGLVEVQLQVISEYADALVRFVGSHKWERDTVDMAEKYRDSICKKMNEIAHEISMNLMDELSIASTQKNIEAASQE